MDKVMTTLAGHQQMNFQVHQDMADDIRLVARQRGQTISEFIRRAVDRELELDARSTIVD